MFYYADLDAQLPPRPVMSLPKATGVSAIRFSITAEIPPIALRLQPHCPSRQRAALFPLIIRSDRQRAGFGQQIDCSIPGLQSIIPPKQLA